MASGDSAAQKAAATRVAAARYRIRADRADRAAKAWARGAEGEVALAEAMAPLAADGYYHLDDRRFPESKGNLDHLLIGPAGVFVVDAKSWTGAITVQGTTLLQNGRRRDRHVEGLRSQAVELAAVLADLMGDRRRPPVRAVMCFVKGDGVSAPTSVERVHVLNSSDLVTFVRGMASCLDQRDIDKVMAGLLQRLPPRAEPAAVSTSETTVVTAPDEAVFFVQRWSKHGHRRLYVKADDGSDLGFLDLRTGQVYASAEAWRPVLARLLPHYLAEPAR